MIIAVTGAAGFLGSHIAKHMIDQGHHVIGLDNLIGGSRDNIPHRCEFYHVDLYDLDVVTKAFKDVDIVYHCAATPHEGLSVFSPYFITRNNLGISTSVITAAIKNKVKRIIYCSSMARYGNQPPPFSEDTRPQPVDPYGVCKVAGEDILKSLCETHGVEWVIAVPHNIIGPNQKYDDPFRNVVSIMLNRMLLGKPPIIYGDGEQVRCFSYVDDCIDSLIKMATADVQGEVINIGPDEEFVTINKVAEICANVAGYNGEPIYMPDRPREVKHAVCNSDKARRLLNYQTSTDLKTGIEKTYQYIKQRGARDFEYHLDLEIINEHTPQTWKDKLI